MNQPPIYTEYHPRWYRPRMTTYWWLHKPAYFLFILREVSSVFIAYFVGITLAQLYALRQGEAAYLRFESAMHSPLALTLNAVSLVFVLLHAVTWFNLAPKAMVVHFRGKPVPGKWIAISNYAAWLVATALVALVVLWR